MNVIVDINGMVCFARKVTYVLEIWFGIKLINNVFVLHQHIGVVTNVSQFQNALEDNILMSLHSNAHVCPVLNGMGTNVFNANMVKYGILQL